MIFETIENSELKELAFDETAAISGGNEFTDACWYTLGFVCGALSKMKCDGAVASSGVGRVM